MDASVYKTCCRCFYITTRPTSTTNTATIATILPPIITITTKTTINTTSNKHIASTDALNSNPEYED